MSKKDSNREVLKSILDTYQAELVSYEYYQKIFGNYVILINFGEQTHTFVTDRGEIYHNDKMMCDSSYHVDGSDDTFTKLLEIIKQELSGAV